MDSKPFNEDRLGRLNYAEGICKLISEINKGVIAIDGEWGIGKTWFGSNLKLLILQREIANAIWIDAFDEDWNSDPVLAIVASIANTLKSSRKNKFIKNISPAISVLIPTFAKIAAKTAGTAVGIDKELVDD
jgi:predicted KAP-like P-loop ATPase